MRTHFNLTNNFEIDTLFTAFADTRDANYFTSGESHDFWEVVIVTDGEIGVTAGTQVYHLCAGQAILHVPNEFHNLWNEKNKPCSFIIFTFSARNLPCPETRVFSIPDLALPEAILKEMRDTFQTRRSSVYGIKEGCERQAAIAVKRLELFLLEILCTSNDVAHAVSTSQSSKNYATAVHFLEANIDKSLSVTEIAKACNMGEVNLKKTFSRYAGMGVMQYFNRLKIYSAIHLLRKGATVREAAEAVGFSNQNYFCKVFTRIMERPPKYFKN